MKRLSNIFLFLVVYFLLLLHSGTAVSLYRVPAAIVVPKTTTRLDVNCIKRTPSAALSSAKVACKTFLESALLLIPVGLVVKIGSRSATAVTMTQGLKLWALEGIKVGTEWSRISALFSAAEEFCSGVRAKKDKWNAYIGSGIVSAVLRINEGPVGVVQGFVAGFGFFYAIDLLIPGAANMNVPIDDVATSIRKEVRHSVGRRAGDGTAAVQNWGTRVAKNLKR